MRIAAAAILALLAAPVLAESPDAAAVRLALADARTLPPVIATSTRYLSLAHLPIEQREDYARTLSFHLNSLSREATIVPPRWVYSPAEAIGTPRAIAADGEAEAVPTIGPELLALVLLDYGIDPRVYGRLVRVDPYLHVLLATGKEPTPAAAPWLPPRAIAELIQRTQSQVPVLRADWFLSQTAIQADRVAGYYDMLGVGKSKADFDRLVGLDEAAAKRLRKEIHAIVSRSGVALGNRQIVRFQAITGAYWVTLDSKASTGKNNAVRLLDADYQFDASEIYGTLPNGLFAYFLADSQGTRQDTAPDFIASDSTATGNDRRVHAGKSCIVCHAKGIQPIDDWARSVYRPPVKLGAVDYAREVRLRQLYASDLAGPIADDQQRFDRAVRQCNGWSAQVNAEKYGLAWDRYVEEDRDLVRAAREVGVLPSALRMVLRARLNQQPGSLDPLLVGLLQGRPIRAEHWEEVFPLLMAMFEPAKD